MAEAIRSGSCSSTSLAVTMRNRSGSTFEAADSAIRSRKDGLPLNNGLEEKPMLCIKIYLNCDRRKQFLVGGLPTVAWRAVSSCVAGCGGARGGCRCQITLSVCLRLSVPHLTTIIASPRACNWAPQAVQHAHSWYYHLAAPITRGLSPQTSARPSVDFPGWPKPELKQQMILSSCLGVYTRYLEGGAARIPAPQRVPVTRDCHMRERPYPIM